MAEQRTSLNNPARTVSLPRPLDYQTDRARVGIIVDVAVGVGLLLCVVAIIIGLRMALHATVVPCPDGHYFPPGTTDFRCYAHKHAGDGTSIAIFAVVFGIVLGLAAFIAHTQLRRPDPR